MIERYRHSIISLIEMLHAARISPYKNIDTWLKIQEILIKKHLYIERKYRLCKKEISLLHKTMKNPARRLSKEESLKIKGDLKQMEFRIEGYKYLLTVFKSIGDGIAFTFLNKLDIKPQNFKETAGFISEKAGLVLEKKILRYSFKKQLVGILHDITSVLKYCDITIIKENNYPLALEIKSSHSTNSRISRQQENAKSIYNYLTNDVTHELYGISGNMRRVALNSTEINYVENINLLIHQAKRNHTAHELVEQGLLYIVSYGKFSEESYEKIFSENKIQKSIAGFLLKNDIIGQAYYPLVLNLQTPDHYWDFINERVSVLLICDLATVEAIAMENGFSVSVSEEDDWFLHFKEIGDGKSEREFKISRHLFGRVFHEFVSLKWLLNDIIHKGINLELQ